MFNVTWEKLFVLGYFFISLSKAASGTLLISYLKFTEAEKRKHVTGSRG
jgi:hypothetical protein